MAEHPTITVALLRGINVGGNNKVPMRELAALFADLGATRVKTYIQSGNVVFKAPPSNGHPLAPLLSAAIAERFGCRVPVVLRTAEEMHAILQSNPFASEDPKHLHAMFLSEEPVPAAVAALDPHRSSPDRFVVRGREIFLFCPNGLGQTKLTNDWFDRRLGVVSTARNWRTMTTLSRLAEEVAAG